jgi:UDP-N-acetylmuramate dehydrogenase
MLDVRFNVPATEFSTMRAGGTLAQLITITTPEDIPEAYATARTEGLPLRILGGGSNTVFGDTNLPYLFAHMQIQGIRIEHETESTVTIACGAGVPWDALVDWCVTRGYAGVELLSWIPGTVGAAPVQNIGAYGTEFANVAHRIEFFDTETQQFTSFTNQQCDFGYRTSIFKREPSRRIISKVALTLSRVIPALPAHPEIRAELSEDSSVPLLMRIRNAVIAVRTRKLPDPRTIPNCGSFFINPIVSNAVVEHIQKEFADVPTYSATGGIKLSAGWLIERAGYKGFVRGATGTHDRHALVIVNRGGATGSDIQAMANEIAEAVFNRFGVRLVPEVNFIF